MLRSQVKSSFNGIIDEVPDIAVDNFEDTTYYAYFLSHCHSDHTSGLFSDALLQHLKKNGFYIYMSEMSAAIVRHESKGGEIMDYVRPLKVGFEGTTTITLPVNEVTETEPAHITVSLLPAAHCFGAVMFLFKTLYYNVLYTGDCRVNPDDVAKYAQLYEDGEVIKLETLYLDTTFLTDEHLEFPTRTESVAAAIERIRPWLLTGNRFVALHTSARYGYEFVFNQIYQHLGEKVYVRDDIWELYRQFPNIIKGVTNDAENARIHLCRNRSENKPHHDCVPDHCPNATYLYVHFSALKWGGYKIDDNAIEVKKGAKNYRIDVCFATHCSRNELEYFVNFLSPKYVIGFPNRWTGKGKVESDDEIDDESDEEVVEDEDEAEMFSEESRRESFVD